MENSRSKSKPKGYLQVYTGNGKGKTTAALGLALRAAGARKRVFIAQFAKGQKYAELAALRKLRPLVEVRQYGLKCFIRGKAGEKDKTAARKGLLEAARIIAAGKHDIVILDEANIATYYNLFSAAELLDAVSKRAPHIEIVITGRYADKKIMDAADLITEMREIRHYYSRGIQARTGIEK